MENINKVKIRMYRQGFGDCFLIRFFSDTTLSYKMLIDCGLKLNDSVASVSIEDVVKDIKTEVNIKKGNKNLPQLDALVVTHEHWDHVSAFKPEKKMFDDFEVDNIWMAWTENPNDKIGVQINQHLRENVTALGIASQRLVKATEDNKKAMTGISPIDKEQLGIRENFNVALSGMLDFYGPFSATINTESGIKIKDNFAISAETQKAFDHIKTKIAKKDTVIKYCDPGTLIENIDKLPGIRIYVMGPPKDKRINKDSPSSGANKEVYLGLNNETMNGFVKGLLVGAGANEGFDNGNPFKNIGNIYDENPSLKQYFDKTYYNKSEDWRTIDNDWLDMAGALALQMDSDTNNTSLVLAIEFIESGKIMLFPGDAQVGNWESWHDYTWKVNNNGISKEINATDILNKTVFYKAGHHSSHNATLKEKGLELMTDENLVVFVPEKNDQYKGIPYPPLVDRLNEKAKGRVLFSADINFDPDDALKTKPSNISKADWDKFKNNIKVTKTYIEYTVEN